MSVLANVESWHALEVSRICGDYGHVVGECTIERFERATGFADAVRSTRPLPQILFPELDQHLIGQFR